MSDEKPEARWEDSVTPDSVCRVCCCTQADHVHVCIHLSAWWSGQEVGLPLPAWLLVDR